MPKRSSEAGSKPVASNRQALHDYFIEHSYEAGIALTGTEIKSIRDGRVNLRDGYVQLRKGEAWLINVHISPYDFGNRENHEPRRERRLLTVLMPSASISTSTDRPPVSGGSNVIEPFILLNWPRTFTSIRYRTTNAATE